MNTIFETYIRELRRYQVLCESLFSILENNVSVKEGSLSGFTLKPTQKSILAEILQLEQDTVPKFRIALPPHSWVQPAAGQIKANGEVWEFKFHGMGLSFGYGDSVDNWKDVSIEFSKQGKIAVTEWTTLLFFKTNCQGLPEYQEIYAAKKDLFLQAIENNYLIPIEPLLTGDDQTYDFGEKLR